MKKMMFVAAMAAMVLSSCAKEETVNDATLLRGAIGFESFIGKSTKAIEAAAWKDGDKICVTGYATDAAMTSATDLTTLTPIVGLANTEVTVTDVATTPKWSYSPAAYWVADKFHSFFAAAPSEITFQHGKVTLTVPALVENQIDMMVSDPERQTAAYTAGSTPPAVGFTMRHVLSQVLFKAKIAVEDTSVSDLKIKSITIAPKNSAAFAADGEVNVAGKATATDPNVVTAGTSTAASYLLTPTAAVAVSTAAYTDIKHQTDHVAMLLPQAAPAFTVSVVVNGTGVTGDVAITFDAPAITWEPNKKYSYKLDINVPIQVLKREPIEIGNPTIEAWDAPADQGTTPSI